MPFPRYWLCLSADRSCVEKGHAPPPESTSYAPPAYAADAGAKEPAASISKAETQELACSSSCRIQAVQVVLSDEASLNDFDGLGRTDCLQPEYGTNGGFLMIE